MIQKKEQQLKTPIYASLALAFASFGDAFLYPFLPLNALQVGVPIVWVGVLLSINRFVRIFSNTWMVHLFAKFGLRLITIIAVLLAITSTAGYAIASGILFWLIFRILWGLSFSAMRISMLGYALQQPKQGLALGISRGVYELGPMATLLLAPILLQYLESDILFMVLAALSLPAIYFAWNLPKSEDKTLPHSSKSIFLKIPSTYNTITFLSSFLIDGILIVVLGILFLHYKSDNTPIVATGLAALYLGYRRVCLVVLSPAGGWMADKIGLNKVFIFSLAFVILGLLILVSGYIEVGALIVFTFYSIHSAITPGNVSESQINPLSSVAENATWRDLGSAIGTLSGGFLISSNHLSVILFTLTLALGLLLLYHLGTAQKAYKLLFLWK